MTGAVREPGAVPQISENDVLDMSNPRIHLLFGRQLAVEQVGERVSVREKMVGQSRNGYVKFDRIDIAPKIAPAFAFLQKLGDVVEHARVAGPGQPGLAEMPSLVEILGVEQADEIGRIAPV